MKQVSFDTLWAEPQAPARCAARAPVRRERARALWLCLRFPLLPLEIFTRGGSVAAAAMVVEGRGRAQRVCCVNDAARRLGVTPGMAAGAAHALGALRALRRDADAERAALERLAGFAGQLSPMVSLAPPDALLVEIRGSLRLFGGREALLARVEAWFPALGYTVLAASAPAPLAAWWLARAGETRHVSERARLAGALASLPVAVLDLDLRTQEAIRGLGVRTLGELVRLPRAGIVRRFGAALLERLDRAYGRRADPRPVWEPPPRFDHRLELPQPVRDAGALVFAAQRQILELVGTLRARCAGVQRLTWRLEHRGRPPTAVPVGLLAPARNAAHLLHLTRERLERTRLPAPVEALALEADGFVPLVGASAELFDDAPARAEAQGRALIERLRARLGSQAVKGVHCVAEHRPERAWRACEPGEAAREAPPAGGPRPPWLLAAPRLLETMDDRPLLEGVPLALLGEGERIESGWWDGGDVARDYFVAADPDGACFWVYRDLRTRRWYLHGMW